MAVHDNNDSASQSQRFEQLFAAHTNGDLTGEERARLHELAGQDVGRRGALAEVEAVHEMLQVESEMRERVLQPVDAAEESDEGYQRLVAAAARAEVGLRADLEAPQLLETRAGTGAESRPADAQGRRPWLYVVAAAVLLLAGFLGFWGNDRGPGLDTSDPGLDVLTGSSDIFILPNVSSSKPRIRWHENAQAKYYDATILDQEGKVVLGRTNPEFRKDVVWDLSAADLELLQSHQQLFLRVVAFGTDGTEVARTKKRQLLVIEK